MHISDYFLDTCTPLCPLECNTTEYTYKQSSLELNGDIYVDYLIKNKNLSSDFVNRSIDKEAAKNSIVYLSVFYDNLFYTECIQVANMDIMLLIANLGGTIGLFLGVSTLSLCELIDVLIEIYFIQNKKAKSEK